MYIKALPYSGMIPTLDCITQKLENFLQFQNAEKDTPFTPKKSPCLSLLHSLRCPSSSVIKQPKKARSFILLLTLFIYLFIYGCAGSSLLHELSLVAASRDFSSLLCSGLSLQRLLLFQSIGSRA